MSYLVLARKWRPRNFEELVGQDQVRRALTNALNQERLHHAYLFTGTRGVGKTTVARILAKCLNCESGISARPCGECAACRSIDEGRFIDLIEVDAASRTKVEDTRELLENVQYAPASGRFKIYLIDEVHMLSTHSFNALLKTLEEPPLHAKFLLATTDPHKLPPTILSRCLQFNLKPMPADTISAHLADIAGRESIEVEAEAVRELAVAARGSMRDALSLMDQAIGLGDGRIGAADVALMLGSIARERVTGLIRALASGEAEVVLGQVEELAAIGADFETLLGQMLALLHRLALGQVSPAVFDDPAAGDLRPLAESLHPEDVQLWYQIGLNGRRDLPHAPDPRSAVEMVLLRMLVFRPQREGNMPAPAVPGPAAAVPAASATPAAGPATPPAEGTGAVAPTVGLAPAAPEPAAAPSAARSGESRLPPAPEATASVSTSAAEAAVAGAEDWPEVVAALPVTGMALQLAQHSFLRSRDGAELALSLDPAHAHLNTPTFVERLRAALSQHFGQPIKLRIAVGEAGESTPAALAAQDQAERLEKAREAIESDPIVGALRETFDARLEEGSIRPPEEPG